MSASRKVIPILLGLLLTGCLSPNGGDAPSITAAEPAYSEDFPFRGYTVATAVPCATSSLCVNTGYGGYDRLDAELGGTTTRLSAVVTWSANTTLSEEMTLSIGLREGDRHLTYGRVQGTSPLEFVVEGLDLDRGDTVYASLHWRHDRDTGRVDVRQDFDLILTASSE